MLYDVLVRESGEYIIGPTGSGIIKNFTPKYEENKPVKIYGVGKLDTMHFLDNTGHYWIVPFSKMLKRSTINKSQKLEKVIPKISDKLVLTLSSANEYYEVSEIMILLISSFGRIKKMSYMKFFREDMLRAFREKPKYEKKMFPLEEGEAVIQAFIVREFPTGNLCSMFSDDGLVLTFNVGRINDSDSKSRGVKLYGFPEYKNHNFFLEQINCNKDSYICYIATDGSIMINSNRQTTDTSLTGFSFTESERTFKHITGYSDFIKERELFLTMQLYPGDTLILEFTSKTKTKFKLDESRMVRNRTFVLKKKINEGDRLNKVYYKRS